MYNLKQFPDKEIFFNNIFGRLAQPVELSLDVRTVRDSSSLTSTKSKTDSKNAVCLNFCLKYR